MRVWLPPLRLENFWISEKLRAAGWAATVNVKAYPAERSAVESAARMSCDRFTSTTSPAENALDGVSVTVWSVSENVSVPVFVPLERPKTRNVEGVTEDVSSAWSNVIETAVVVGATASRTGLVETTCGSAACAATERTAVTSMTIGRRARMGRSSSNGGVAGLYHGGWSGPRK